MVTTDTPPTDVYRIEVISRLKGPDRSDSNRLVALLREAGLVGIEAVAASRLFFLEGAITRAEAARAAADLLTDPLCERNAVFAAGDSIPAPGDGIAFEVHLRPGVMDPVAETTLAELQAEQYPVRNVRTARRYVATGSVRQDELLAAVRVVLANDCIEQVVPGTAGVQPSPQAPVFAFKLRHVPMRGFDSEALGRLSRDGHLFLSIAEMQAIQEYYRTLGRDPTDLELETLAQTWSEHCVHKTLKSPIVYRGAALPALTSGRAAQPLATTEPAERRAATSDAVEIRYSNLLKETIARATEELIAAGRGPECLSVFKDNAGVIGFDDDDGVAFKVETHNHPSAIEPYGGAATGVGGCIRDVIGCGLGARPIANTDVFCVGPSDWPHDRLPKGVLHPLRILRGVVRGVADYGNRMGIPTVNGAIHFDPRYLGNPLVYCGCVGLIPRDKVEKAARSGDLIVLIGGRTGRDGIHGATFSSAELTDTHADEFSHAVQIGNAITEKRCLDAVLRARDDTTGCLYSAITDCGAGGLSSAVGEMGAQAGAVVELERVPLKYAGLRYDEIWISEAQERMVLAVPPEQLDRFLEIMRAEEVEATVIGVFGEARRHAGTQARRSNGPRLVVRDQGNVVGELDMAFLHHGLPNEERLAEWWPEPAETQREAQEEVGGSGDADLLERLRETLRSPVIASKRWVIRQYDHEVQGASVIKPLCGPGLGPSDAAVLRPRLGSQRGIAIGCGLAPHLSDVDPYWMAAASIDEALRNVVCVGGDPAHTAVLDNFCWGRTDDPRQLGALVRACQACHDVALIFGVPFISGKDSLNNEFALDAGDVEPLLEMLRAYAGRAEPGRWSRQTWKTLEARVRRTRRLSIPGTLLISAVSIVADARRCVTPDLKAADNPLFLVGGLPETGLDLRTAAAIHRCMGDAIAQSLVAACHDCSDGGWLTAVAEMAIAGDRGVEIAAGPSATHAPFGALCAGYVVETSDAGAFTRLASARGVDCAPIGHVRADRAFVTGTRSVAVADLRAAWTGCGD